MDSPSITHPVVPPPTPYKYRISRLYRDWAEVKAELGTRADDLDEHRVLTLVDCDVDECDDPDCEYCAEGSNDEHPSVSIMETGFHYVNRAGYYIIDPPWENDDVDDGGNIPDEMVDFSYLTATDILAARSDEESYERTQT